MQLGEYWDWPKPVWFTEPVDYSSGIPEDGPYLLLSLLVRGLPLSGLLWNGRLKLKMAGAGFVH